MRLTKRKAVEITRELWQWLAEHPLAEKEEWHSGWAKYGEMLDNCPCCEYMHRHGGDCEACPLIGLWTGREGSMCFDDGSPWVAWCKACPLIGLRTDLKKVEKAKMAALRMVTICDEWLNKEV